MLRNIILFILLGSQIFPMLSGLANPLVEGFSLNPSQTLHPL